MFRVHILLHALRHTYLAQLAKRCSISFCRSAVGLSFRHVYTYINICIFAAGASGPDSDQRARAFSLWQGDPGDGLHRPAFRRHCSHPDTGRRPATARSDARAPGTRAASTRSHCPQERNRTDGPIRRGPFCSDTGRRPGAWGSST
jgi:hypothetical protein